jgi:hypothetical protein
MPTPLSTLVTQMRELLESAPASIRPLVTLAAAEFIKRSESTWGQLASDPSLLEQAFHEFLTTPESYDYLVESMDEAVSMRSFYNALSTPLLQARLQSANAEPQSSVRDEKIKTIRAILSKRNALEEAALPRGNGPLLPRPMGYAANPSEYVKCPNCGGDGKPWPRGTGTVCTVCQGTGLASKSYLDWAGLREDAPAVAAGNGAVAGIGQPEGSTFGEPGVLQGATTKTKKNKKAPDLDEAWFEPLDALENKYGPKGAFPTSMLFHPAKKSDVPYAQWGRRPSSIRTVSIRDLYAIQDTINIDLVRHNLRLPSMVKTYLPEVGSYGGKLYILDGYHRIAGELYRGKLEVKAEVFDLDTPLTEERETFANADVFEVDMDRWMNSRFGKNRYHRYSRYVGSDKVGEEIRQHGRTKTKRDIILKDERTGVMTWLLRRKRAQP